MEKLSEEVKENIEYCLNCINRPCMKGCPLSNTMPDIMQCIKNESLEQAYIQLLNNTILGSICGRICPHYKQCMGNCIRGIKGKSVEIGNIEAFVSDYGLENKLYKEIDKTNELKGKNIAVIGGGPAGITCSYFLSKFGANVTIYEKHEKLGGIIEHGIPDFRLDKEILDKTVKLILDMNINIEYNKQLGKDFNIGDLKEEYDAIFISIGANISTNMNISGESLSGVYGGNELLERRNHPNYEGKNVAVIGGGNVAMDTSRTIKRLGAKNVYVIYRRAREQMPAEEKEIEDAEKDGVKFLFQNNIIKILGKDKVEQIECIKTELVKREGDTRLSPINIEGSNYVIDMDYVIMAVGSKPEEDIITNFAKNKWGYIQVDENMRTSIKNVYAGGDIVGEKATIAWAAKSGKNAAYSIKEDLKSSK